MQRFILKDHRNFQFPQCVQTPEWLDKKPIVEFIFYKCVYCTCIFHTVYPMYPVDRFFKKMKMTLTLLLSVNIVIYLWYSHHVNDVTWLELIYAFFAFENTNFVQGASQELSPLYFIAIAPFMCLFCWPTEFLNKIEKHFFQFFRLLTSGITVGISTISQKLLWYAL